MFIDLTLVSVSLRDASMEIREIGVDCVGAINGSWFWVTLVFKGRGKKQTFSIGTNGHKTTN